MQLTEVELKELEEIDSDAESKLTLIDYKDYLEYKKELIEKKIYGIFKILREFIWKKYFTQRYSWKKAYGFAIAAHESINHKRKYTGDPYFNHLEEVVDILGQYYSVYCEENENIFSAAFLHDILEDTGISKETILDTFGQEVLNMVILLTDEKVNNSGRNRSQRKKIDRYRLSKAPKEVQDIKIADLISNSISIKENDPKFYHGCFRKEAILLLNVLEKAEDGLKDNLMKILEYRGNVRLRFPNKLESWHGN